MSVVGAERRVAIYLEGDVQAWAPTDPETRGLGGAETAAVRVAEGLARRGFAPEVFANLGETVAKGVTYRPRADFDPRTPRRAVIASRAPALFDLALATCRKLLWLHDPVPGPDLTPERANEIDAVLAVSRWHAEKVRRERPELSGRVEELRNGIDRALFEGSRARRPRVLYTSQAERGLEVLLELWPQIRARVPKAELAVCQAPVYEYIRTRSTGLSEYRTRLDSLARQDGVHQLGSLAQPELAELMLSSRIWVHPSWDGRYGMPTAEISCISAMEAQAAGLWTVVSGSGALPETVRVGAVVDPRDAPGERWRRALEDEVVRGLRDALTQRRAELEGPAAVRDLDWDGVAAQMAELVHAGERRSSGAQPA
jgi:glycosyltransferase involved in cell wall biosynthesis